MPTIAGRKIGFTNRGIWPKYGVHEPIWGFVTDQTLISSTNDRALVSLRGLANPRIEPEICFKLASPPPRGASPGQLLAAIEWVAHSIEIVQCQNPQWKVTLADCVAQNALHGRLIVGTPMGVAANLDKLLPAVQVILRKNGKEVDRGIGANVLDSPLLAMAHLIEMLAKQPGARALVAGEIISTGTLTDAHPVAPGETWSTEIAGLPLHGLEIRFQ